ncbi:MAG: DUF5717 family protein [Defluviitaleaceae bacterium]|nr:DUF5717 family protein [Defluviitaleaceae bacterium]
MPDANLLIKKLESRLSRRADVKTAIALALRCWLAYSLSDEEGDRTYLQNGYHALITAQRRNDVHLPLLTLTIFIAIESGHFDTANELLDKAMAYKSFLRVNEPTHNGELCYLYAYMEIKQRRVRSARKHWRNLTELTETHSLSQRVMLGRLHLEAGEYEDAYAQLMGAYISGCRSPYVYEGLYRYYRTAPAITVNEALLGVLHYAAVRGADTIGIFSNIHGNGVFSAVIEGNPAGGERLYRASGYHPLLKDICARRIRKKDYGPEAYAYYLAAERKQVHVPGLYTALIKAAYENRADRVNHYPMQQFLQSAEPDDDLAVYVYHLLLTDPALSDLLPAFTQRILRLAVRCLEQNKEGREANSLYYYYWANGRLLGESNALMERAEEIIEADLTRFELTAPPETDVRFVYITDAAKRGMDVYEMPEAANSDGIRADNNRLIIEAAGEGISYTCLGAGRRSVLDEVLTVRRMVEGVDKTAYRHFFDKGDRRFYLLRTLSDAHLSNPGKDSIPILETMLAQKNINKAYRMRLLLTLGQIYFDAGWYTEALEHYKAVDENTPNLPRQLLQIRLHTEEYEKAAELIDRKHPHIPTDILMDAITRLLPIDNCRPLLAGAAHALLSDGRGKDLYDELLELTLAHFPFSQSELAALSRELAKQDKHHPKALDKRLLEGSLWMATIDADAQKAFARLQNSTQQSSTPQDDSDDLLQPFVDLCVYHMLTANFKPEYETLDILEKWYLKTEPADNILALALGQVCLRHNLSTFHSERIIADAIAVQKHNGILLPAFKEHKPAQIPFIEKHQPFLYKGLPGKEVYLYYRIDPEGPFLAKPMDYLCYGMYLACVPLFYNEEITYYFSEEMPTGSITTREAAHRNTTPFLYKKSDESPDSSDPFFTVNNAIILEQMFKHDQVETLITGLVKDTTPVRSSLM